MNHANVCFKIYVLSFFVVAVEGWVVFISGLHPESQEDDVKDACSDYGKVTNIQMNLDRRTGFVKGYALVEFGDRVEAERAIEGLNGSKLLGKLIRVDWAFIGKSNMDVSSGNSLRKKHKPHHEQSNE